MPDPSLRCWWHADADVIVIGSRRRSHSIGSPLGRVTHAVPHHSHCPVVLVPHL
ncbi:universal stress protein [Streptomyces sp. NBC_00057]|uniref:universal stress protein n=1 Tax=Streptomyces sp. NBC_00057 TaxID=2975634 RepID=UPI00386A1D6A